MVSGISITGTNVNNANDKNYSNNILQNIHFSYPSKHLEFDIEIASL